MALFDVLVPMLRTRFPDLAFTGPSDQPPQLTIPASHPDVGDIVLQDDDEEITAFLGHFTHRHFSNYDEIPTAEKEKIIAEDVVRFLENLFADRIVMWGLTSRHGRLAPDRFTLSTEPWPEKVCLVWTTKHLTNR